MSNILIAGHDPYGFLESLREGITKYTNLTYDYLNYDPFLRSFSYKCFGHRIQNFLLKSFTGKNLKKVHLDIGITNAIAQLKPHYDMILILRPDFIMDHHLEMLRKKTNHFVAYYWDTIKFFPRKLEIRKYFDRILSFDPVDCKVYGLEFLSNYYYYDSLKPNQEYQVYNLSNLDQRKATIEKVGSLLEDMGVSFYFRGITSKTVNSNYIKHSPSRVNYADVLTETARSEIVLDVSKNGQNGLSLRPLEALGLNKKLITTNASIAQYDFYNPNNILILDPAHPTINKDFLNSAFEPIPASIKEKYHLKNWLNTVLS